MQDTLFIKKRTMLVFEVTNIWTYLKSFSFRFRLWVGFRVMFWGWGYWGRVEI